MLNNSLCRTIVKQKMKKKYLRAKYFIFYLMSNITLFMFFCVFFMSYLSAQIFQNYETKIYIHKDADLKYVLTQPTYIYIIEETVVVGIEPNQKNIVKYIKNVKKEEEYFVERHSKREKKVKGTISQKIKKVSQKKLFTISNNHNRLLISSHLHTTVASTITQNIDFFPFFLLKITYIAFPYKKNSLTQLYRIKTSTFSTINKIRPPPTIYNIDCFS